MVRELSGELVVGLHIHTYIHMLSHLFIFLGQQRHDNNDDDDDHHHEHEGRQEDEN